MNDQLDMIVSEIKQLDTQNIDRVPADLKKNAIDIVLLVRALLYPQVFPRESRIQTLRKLRGLLLVVCSGIVDDEELAEKITDNFIKRLPEIAELLHSDVQAGYDGDPAARSLTEVIIAYPAFEAISTYRIAHVLFNEQLPLLPRIMTEYAHRTTGIDIHPGATIGRSFFIDHGTGVVIGETCIIGDNVKLYQGVTLGAKSFEKDDSGNPIKGIHRHPTIGNNVVIYAGATILGGDTVIGDNCTIGGNVWLTHSIEDGSKRLLEK